MFSIWTPRKSDDEVLIAASGKGDTEAFDELIRKYEKRVYNFAYRLTGNSSDAADVAQEAFIRAYRSVKSFRGDSSFTTWMYRITTNIYLDMRKKASFGKVVSIEERAEKKESGRSAEIADPAPPPEELAITEERRKIIRDAVNSLPEQHRIVITLFRFEERTYEEIASILNIPVGTVKSRINRAGLALAKILQARKDELF
ncbi:MAG: sigma-70 family RNA polymerase sigma factor [Abditibacteriota bacterium]|nr:sigma-70 family RNA polymerase sigma factor [Abditibacteriota bacterium]MBP5737523.1 sigma-70 family RNA polymerase sigma factor [Abditibacteriota bacterium]